MRQSHPFAPNRERKGWGNSNSDLRICFRDFGHDFANTAQTLIGQMILGQAFLQVFEPLLGSIYDLEQFQVRRGNRSRIHECLKINHAVPVLAAVDYDQNLLGQLFRLRERENFKQLIHGAESAGEDDEGFRKICEPEFAHEEVMEIEVERRSDIRIRILLKWQANV